MGSSCRQSPPRSLYTESGDSSAASRGPRNRIANSTSQGFLTITRPMLQCQPPYQGGLLVLQGATSRVARAGVSWSGARESNPSCWFGRPVVHLEQVPQTSPPPLRVRGHRMLPAVSSDGAGGRDRTGFRRSGTRPGFQNAPAWREPRLLQLGPQIVLPGHLFSAHPGCQPSFDPTGVASSSAFVVRSSRARLLGRGSRAPCCGGISPPRLVEMTGVEPALPRSQSACPTVRPHLEADRRVALLHRPVDWSGRPGASWHLRSGAPGRNRTLSSAG